MKDAILLAVMTGALAALDATAEAQQPPPRPSPTVPAAAPLPPAAPPSSEAPSEPGGPAPAATGGPAPTAMGGAAKKSDDDPPPVITLKDSDDSLPPGEYGSARVDGRDVKVTVTGDTLKATLTGTTNAYAWAGYRSQGVARVRMVQQFDVSRADPKNPYVSLKLSGKVDGYLLTDEWGTACLRLASASVYSACGGPSAYISFPPACSVGCHPLRIEQTVDSSPLIVPAGRCVLVADFVAEATAEGFFHGHGEAAFSPTSVMSIWFYPDMPFAKVDHKGFGFTVTVKAGAP